MIKDIGRAKWQVPGDKIDLVFGFLYSERTLHMELTKMVPNEIVQYVTKQKNLPDAFHTRLFRSVPGGCEYEAIIEYQPRDGFWPKFVDQNLLLRAVKQSLVQTIINLETSFGILEVESRHQSIETTDPIVRY